MTPEPELYAHLPALTDVLKWFLAAGIVAFCVWVLKHWYCDGKDGRSSAHNKTSRKVWWSRNEQLTPETQDA